MARRRTRWLRASIAVAVAVVLVVVGLNLRPRPGATPSASPVDSAPDPSSSSSTTSTSTPPTAAASPATPVPSTAPVAPPVVPRIDPAAIAAVEAAGSARVLLTLDVTPTGTDVERRAQVQDGLDRVLDDVPAGGWSDAAEGFTTAVIPVTVDRSGLDALATAPGLVSVSATRSFQPVATSSSMAPTSIVPESTNATTTEGADAAWVAGRRGAGTTVAVLDTGVDVAHPFLTATPKSFWEGCFVTARIGYASPCPRGVPMGTSAAPVPGSAQPPGACVSLVATCGHGTHVAGIAVGGTGTNGTPVSGIAPAANLVAVSVFGYNSGKFSADDSDIISALQWLYNVRSTYFPDLVAVNLSLGDGAFHAGTCDSDPLKPAVDQLAAVGVTTVVAAGNDGWSNGVAAPGCISTVLTVGAIDDTTVNRPVNFPGSSTSFSNDGPQVDMMAAGLSICSSVPSGAVGTACPAPNGGTMQELSGTSMATPAVTGAIAVLRGAGIAAGDVRARLQRVAAGSDCVQASAYTIPALRLDVALGLAPQRAAPCAPSAPAAALTSATSATVAWIAPQSAGTGTLTSYSVLASTGQTCTVSAPTTMCTVVGLGLARAITFTVRAISTTGTSGASVATEIVSTLMEVPLTPARIADSRSPFAEGSTVDGSYLGRGRVGADSYWTVRVTGRGGVPSAGVSAVVLNVTATQPTSSSFLTVWPSLTPRPLASNLNFVAGQTVPNLVMVGVGTDGSVSIYNKLGATDVIVDVVGWYPTSTGYSPLAPARLLDTRAGSPTIDGQFNGTGALGRNATLSLTVTGRGGVPVGAGSVVLNVTAVEPTVSGYLTVYPTGSSLPNASNLNFVAGQVVANAVVAEVGTGGRVDIYNFNGTTDVVVDVVGWMPAVGQFHDMSPVRLLDTRAGYPTVDGQYSGVGPIGWGATLPLPVVGRVGIPAGAYAVVLNVTAVSPTVGGYLTVVASGVTRPTASNLNFVAGQVVPNLVVSAIGGDGRVAIFNSSGSTDVAVDVVGWFG